MQYAYRTRLSRPSEKAGNWKRTDCTVALPHLRHCSRAPRMATGIDLQGYSVPTEADLLRSPARSPVISPTNGNMCSPPHLRNSTPLGSSRLASIAEVESSSPLSENRRPSPVLKRESAPTHINLPPTAPFDDALANGPLSSSPLKHTTNIP